MVGESFASGYKDEIGEIEKPKVKEEDALDVQASRDKMMGSLRYGVPINIINHLSVHSLKKFWSLSEAWYWFLGLHGPSENDESRSTDWARSQTSRKRLALRSHEDADKRSQSRGRTREPAWRHLFETSSPTAAAASYSLSQSGSVWPALDRASQHKQLSQSEQLSPLNDLELLKEESADRFIHAHNFH